MQKYMRAPCTDVAAQMSDHARSPRPVTTTNETTDDTAIVDALAPTAKPKERAQKPGKLTKMTLLALTDEQEQVRQKMFAVAALLGLVCQDLRGIRADVGQQIFSRMTNRIGKSIYQVITLNCPCARDAAKQMFPESLMELNTVSKVCWKATSMEQARLLIGSLS